MKYHYYLFLAIFLGTVACSGNKKEQKEETVETTLPEATNEVTTVLLKSTDFNHELISNGKLTARRYAELRFESAEPIAAIYVKNGERVNKGQKIAELAPFRIQNKLQQAKNTLEQTRLELQDVLIGQGYAPEDSTKVPADIMQLAGIKSGYKQALAQYELARHEEEKSVLRAPFDGVVANLFGKQFNTASTADVFCVIIDPSSLAVSFSVLESELPLIKTGDKVEVSPFALNDVKTTGQITEVNPLVNTDGMVQVKAAVANNGKLFEGMNARVSIQRSLGQQLVIPKSALVLRSGKQVIFTLVDGKAYWNYVTTGLENAGHYTVTEGLKEGDTVITSGNINLAHESPVKVAGASEE
ncbi:efflux RND transporter periplasmic adaptor subunit [Massilibacteroides sp.]|uniref:efflux RND transporter periplasmic adaptor subunit n=1 Tax=Massilibacteroides sp. TaxID=2034766 RepID=UPI002611DC62|nr:efflux RND transporter periplasmic adaptor subunit [Massilibacteroides sp.]MDD4515262.1 efflux RND transporter periplasmic adaptor subunit [Massilibacteroides sp.]